MPQAVANGVAFNTYALGSGPPVVMLHGLLVGNLASWYFTGARAVARTHRVFLYDLRGHGRSERARDGYTVPTMCADLEALLAGWQADTPNEAIALVGHSFGALIALEFALRHPEHVSRLVLVEAPIPPAVTSDLTDFLSLGPDEMLKALPAELQGSVARGRRRGNRLLDSLRFLAYETTLIQDLALDYDVPDERLAALTHKTRCIYGSRSSCLAGGERLARLMPGAELIVLEGGHYLPTEVPGELSRLLVEFLDG